MAYGHFDGLLYRWAGLKGIVLAAGALIALFATTLMRRIVDAGAHLFVALLVTLFFGRLGLHALSGRPHIFNLAPALDFDGNRRSRPPRLKTRAHLVAGAIALVWTNLHGGFPGADRAAGLAAIGAQPKPGFKKPRGGRPDWHPAMRWAGLTAAWRSGVLYESLRLGIATSSHPIPALGLDPQSRPGIPVAQFPGMKNMLQFEALLFIGLITAGARLRRGQVIDGLWILALGYMSLRACVTFRSS